METFYLFVPPDRVIGPHPFENIQEWYAVGAIASEIQVCKSGMEEWACLSEVPGHGNISEAARQRINSRRGQLAVWRSSDDPATARQLAKLNYFQFPYEQAGLTKERASELIDCFIAIDPQREASYRSQPPDLDQIAALQSMKHSSRGLDHGAAGSLIKETRRKAREKAWIEPEALDDFVRLEVWLSYFEELGSFDFKKPSKKKLKVVLELLDEEEPGWDTGHGHGDSASHRERFSLRLAETFPELCKSSGSFSMYHPVKGVHY